MSVGKILLACWIGMYGAIAISYIFNKEIIIWRAFAVGIITCISTIVYVIYHSKERIINL